MERENPTDAEEGKVSSDKSTKRFAVGMVLFVAVAGPAIAIAMLSAVDTNASIVEDASARPVYVLDVHRPEAFRRTHLAETSVKPAGGGLPMAAIDRPGPITVQITNSRLSGEVVHIRSRLVTGYAVEEVGDWPVTCAIRVHSEALSLYDAVVLSRRLCSLIGIPDDRVVDWFKQNGYESRLDNSVHQSGKTPDGWGHTVAIRHSFSRDRQQPWVVDYDIHFDCTGDRE